IHRAKTEMLAARRDGGRNLVRFGSAENKNDPGRRLFDGFQQRVKGFACDLVRFIDDENLVAVANGTIAYVFTKLAHLINAAIGGGINLDYIRGAALRYLETAGANTARMAGGSLDTI